MGLNDQLEKIRQAEEWLMTEPPGSRYSTAAKDHLLSLVEWSQDAEVVKAAKAAIQRWMNKSYADV